MSETAPLRAAITGLLGFAAAEDEVLLTRASGGAEETGNERQWAAVPTVAHNTEFKAQQAQRLTAVLAGRTPAAFADIEHTSGAVYAAYAAIPAAAVAADARRVTAALLDGLRAVTDADLVDPARHRWLNGRPLWLQIIVRGFWHPTGHVADYYLRHGQPGQAVALQEHAVATARYVQAPRHALGMAVYSLACAQAQAALTDDASRSLAQAIELNPDVRANAGRDPDLTPLREAGQLAEILAR
ncbi:MAG: hypothetical protein ABSA02_18520 [Trebonia sp.]